jgi:hypothetical protein
MQKLVTIYLSDQSARHGAVEEHLAGYTAKGWRVSSVTPARASSSKAGIWLAVVLEKGGAVQQGVVYGAQPYVEHAQSDEGYPVEPSGVPVTADTPLEVGSHVLSSWGGFWWRAEVIAVKKNTVRVHYPGWDSTWDAEVRRKSLQVDLTSDDE